MGYQRRVHGVQRSCQRFVAFVQCKPGAVGSQALLPLAAVPGTQEQPTLPTNPTWTRLTGMKHGILIVSSRSLRTMLWHLGFPAKCFAIRHSCHMARAVMFLTMQETSTSIGPARLSV